VYRDIKQDNIGFDVRGDVKIFDFGLCKGLLPSLKARDDKGKPVYGYNLTARTGRYVMHKYRK
jgi:serine/threonine protein kinase